MLINPKLFVVFPMDVQSPQASTKHSDYLICFDFCLVVSH